MQRSRFAGATLRLVDFVQLGHSKMAVHDITNKSVSSSMPKAKTKCLCHSQEMVAVTPRLGHEKVGEESWALSGSSLQGVVPPL